MQYFIKERRHIYLAASDLAYAHAPEVVAGCELYSMLTEQ